MEQDKLELRIKILEAQLQEAQSHTYIYQTDTLHCSDGELYIECKEQKKMQAMHLEMIKEAQTEL
jgi:hypothetical protein